YWMSHIIYAESGNQCLEGQIAVGTVVLNRVASSMYPNTIYDVIFDFNCGIQFSPAADGSIYKDPSAMSIMCAKLVLDGAKEADDCLFFAAIKDCWAAYNRPYYCTIQDVDFYL
ncbi:MAG: cell wall hydrolase, partial [Oscillospiraceae bacterium]|nr:cell wall hydrolase [Oscillospiraceae bacterium]